MLIRLLVAQHSFVITLISDTCTYTEHVLHSYFRSSVARSKQVRRRAVQTEFDQLASGIDWSGDSGDDGAGARRACAAGERVARRVLRESRERRLTRDDRDALQVAAHSDGAIERREPRRLRYLLLPHTRVPSRSGANVRLLEAAALSASDNYRLAQIRNAASRPDFQNSDALISVI